MTLRRENQHHKCNVSIQYLWNVSLYFLSQASHRNNEKPEELRKSVYEDEGKVSIIKMSAHVSQDSMLCI